MGKTATAPAGVSKAHKKEQKNKASTPLSSQPKAIATTEPDFMDNKETVEDLNLAGSIWSNLIYNDSIWRSFRCLKKLELNGSDLSTLPSSLEAVAPTLEILFLSENKFNTIPEVVGKLHRLRMISFRGNCLTELSAANLPTSLIWLILTNNQISRIDQNVSKLHGLRKLMLSHNRLTEIPSELGECTNLELVRLASNCINTALPEKFLSLPKLAWISLGGNPISKINTQKMKVIDKSSVFFDENNVLGKGASGTVYKGQYRGKDVAVKVFKHDSKGSDGRPEDEAMINSIIDHHFTVSSHGAFRKESMHDSEDADVIEGMVMELLENATAIGKPPSFATCTRDSGPEDDAKNLATDRVFSIIWNIANALEYVHSTKVMNGDVYLHNTLQCGNGARLSDWGASFVYNDSMVADSSTSADIFEKIEVLAFGRLVQDMLLWYLKVACPDSTGSTLGLLWSHISMSSGPFKDLMASILQPDQSKRPTFGEIKESLAKIPEFQSYI